MMAAAARLPAGTRRILLAICTIMATTIMQALDTTIASVALPGTLAAQLGLTSMAAESCQ
jgi:hypothetical protein